MQVMITELIKPANTQDEVTAFKRYIGACTIECEKLKDQIVDNKHKEEFLFQHRWVQVATHRHGWVQVPSNLRCTTWSLPQASAGRHRHMCGLVLSR
jgi:hypothetical protein